MQKFFASFFQKRSAFLLLFMVFSWQVASRAHLESPPPTIWLTDRHGQFLAQFGDHQDGRTEYGYWPLHSLPERVARATVALEDRRFGLHPGVDPWAVARAVWQHVRGGRSGASTIAMQVARMQHPGARTLWNKAVEAGTALALTARYGREAVLAQYLRLVPYGGGSHGIAQAARWYFGKPVGDLDWAEIALLSAVPHAPARLDPQRPAGLERARRRALRILEALGAQGVIRADEMQAARARLAALHIDPPPARPAVALHDILRLQPMLRGSAPADPSAPIVRTTLDLALQTSIAKLAGERLAQWRGEGAQQVAVMVVRRHDRQVLAAVGSAGFDSLPAGRIDFTRASRSPGSTLKPFLYALALERGVLSAAQVMQDLPDTSSGIGNFDGGFLGPILPRQALANSRNVPAVTLLRQIGLQRSFAWLRDLGLHDLEGSADRFGLSMAIGALPSSLDRLMRAYATLAEDGEDRELAWVEGQDTGAPRALIALPVARQVALFLSDPVARLPSFQRYGPTEYPFAVALKTGTSQGYRDAWVIAWSQAYEVGVWVGRADAGPMTRLSGGSSAAELAQAILLQLHGVTRGDLTADGFAAPPGVRAAELCTATGAMAGPGCASRMTEYVDPARLRVAAAHTGPRLSIVSPASETLFWRNPEIPPDLDRLVLRAQVSPDVRQIVWRVDGEDFATASPSAPLTWPMVAGVHRFQIRLPLEPGASSVVTVRVE